MAMGAARQGLGILKGIDKRYRISFGISQQSWLTILPDGFCFGRLPCILVPGTNPCVFYLVQSIQVT